MARRRRGRPVSGIFLLDKPRGFSSNQALQRIKYLFGAAKAGHTGSLDPLATGVLPLCFGEATKFSQYLLDSDKAYDSTFVFGVATDTGDAEGAVIAEADARSLQLDDILLKIDEFRGDIDQMPPMYSAIKQNGKPLYKMAREGIEVERSTRAVHISRYEVLDFRSGERAELDVRIACSKGTYIRSLAVDLGEALGFPAQVAELRRTAAGPFSLAECVSLESLEALKAQENIAAMDSLLKPMDLALEHFPLLKLPESSGFYLQQGQPVLVRNAPRDGMVRLALDTGEFLGLGEMLDDGRVAPRRLVVSSR